MKNITTLYTLSVNGTASTETEVSNMPYKAQTSLDLLTHNDIVRST